MRKYHLDPALKWFKTSDETRAGRFLNVLENVGLSLLSIMYIVQIIIQTNACLFSRDPGTHGKINKKSNLSSSCLCTNNYLLYDHMYML